MPPVRAVAVPRLQKIPAPETPAQFTIQGSVGDGPIVGATIEVRDANGQLIAETTSDSTADYTIDLPADTELPVRVQAQGGTDLVTGRAPDFVLRSVVFGTNSQTINVSPLTTLAFEAADCTGAVTSSSLAAVSGHVQNDVSMGLDSAIDASAAPVSAANIADIVLANEALGEVVRRTETALVNAGFAVDGDGVLRNLACDLSDGAVDGSGPAVDTRTTLAFRAAEASVLLEVLAGELFVDGASASVLMDSAIDRVLGQAGNGVGSVAPNQALVDQARAALGLFQGTGADEDLLDLMVAMEGNNPVAIAAIIGQVLDASHRNTVTGLAAQIALADSTEVQQLTQRMEDQETASEPVLSFQGPSAPIAAGETATLSWASSGADRCVSSWAGVVEVEGTASLSPQQTTVFTLQCAGLGGSATEEVTVSVSDTNPMPSVTLATSSASVDAGDTITLTWSSENATQCSASGGWSGNRPVSGSESSSALSDTTTFTLSCSGPGGSSSADVTVAVNVVIPAPTVSIAANPATVESGETTVLSWSTTNATSCSASGAWSGDRPVTGSATSAPLTINSLFRLVCVGPGGSTIGATTVNVDQPSPPSVSLSAASTTIDAGGSTTLTWSTSNAVSCSASGAWTGSRDLNGSESTGALASDSTFTLTCTGTGGSASDTVTITTRSAPPELSFTAAASSVPSGSATTLTWSAQNADSCVASGSWTGSRATSGSVSTGALSSDATFTLSCTGEGGSVSDSVTVTVQAVPPELTFSSADSSVASGSATTLTWSAQNADSCVASGSWTGSRATSGSVSTGALSSDATFTLSCTGEGGSVSDSVTVTVQAVPPELTFASADSSVASGSATTLTWSAQNADSCVASGSWTGSRATSGSVSTGALSSDAAYTLTCSGPGGNVSETVSITVVAAPPSLTFAAADTVIGEGSSTTLTWSTENVDSCLASGGWDGTRAASGSESTGALTNTASYTLTCTGPDGEVAETVVVTVAPAPTVSLNASPEAVASGEAATLTWSSSNADTCAASGDWDGPRGTSGSESTGALTSSGTYTLTCQGDGGEGVAVTTVNVTQAVTITWDAPTLNDDGSPLTDLDGFRVYQGSSSRSYDAPVEISDESVRSYQVTLAPGVHYLAVTAFDQDGTESEFSNELVLTID